jgi:Zn-dependent alcohol dehydrogenase
VVSADSIVKVDPHLPLVPAALLACAILTGYGSAAHRANVREGDTVVVVVGAGGIGTAALQAARINGASCIVAVEPVEFKRTAAGEFGATHTAASAEEATPLVRELTRGVMADSVILAPAAITADDIEDGLALTRKGGTCVLTGMPSRSIGPINVNVQHFILMNKTLCGTVFGSCNPRSDIAMLAGLYQSGELRLDER